MKQLVTTASDTKQRSVIVLVELSIASRRGDE
jgi:hypothetical protein